MNVNGADVALAPPDSANVGPVEFCPRCELLLGDAESLSPLPHALSKFSEQSPPGVRRHTTHRTRMRTSSPRTMRIVDPVVRGRGYRMFCPQCGSSITGDARFCSSCGTPLERSASAEAPAIGPIPMATSHAAGNEGQGPISRSRKSSDTKRVLLLAGGLIGACLILLIPSWLNWGSTTSPSTTNTEPTGPTQPAAETAFLASKRAFESRFDNAPNDMVKHQIAGEWKNGGTCSALKTATFTNWIGTIVKIVYNGDLYVDLGDDVTLGASIKTSSPLFQVVSTLKEGDAVEVSGVFDPGTIDRVLNGGLQKCAAVATTDDLLDTDTGTVKTPHFNATFSSIAVAGVLNGNASSASSTTSSSDAGPAATTASSRDNNKQPTEVQAGSPLNPETVLPLLRSTSALRLNDEAAKNGYVTYVTVPETPAEGYVNPNELWTGKMADGRWVGIVPLESTGSMGVAYALMWVWTNTRPQFVGEIPAENDGVGHLNIVVRDGVIDLSWPVSPTAKREKVLTLDGIRLQPLSDRVVAGQPQAAVPAPTAPPTTSAQGQDNPYPPSPGDVDVLGSGAAIVACWPSKDVLDQANQSMVANDDEGFRQLVSQYDPLVLPAGTRVRILDDEPFAGHIEVRVLSGDSEGVACWYPYFDETNKKGKVLAKRLSSQ